MENRAFGVLATALLFLCAYASAARAEPLRVLYAEPFQAQTQRTPGAQKPGAATLRVQAFNHTFELELEDNSRLLRATSAETRARFGAVQLLKGTIKDAPGSWVRLTLRQGRYSGAFWDGSELYAIAPREDLASALLTPMPAAATGIYRLSDTQGGLFSGTCAVAGSAPSSVSPLAKFRALIDELRSAADTAFAAAPREIEVSMIGDFEFTSRFGSSAPAAMLDRMNTVDGIFSSQVGVTTIPTDFITFASDTDPFTSSEPSTLLEQLGNYRNATAVVRGRGLAHLLTGRQLDGNIVGIAYLGSVCTARNGAGLTEVSSFIDSPLVMAHELGHNFGAPHDAEAGSPCASTPANFLMAPEINFSSQFSACSLQQIQSRIATASCIVTARTRDLAVTVPADEIQAVVGQPFDYVVDVTSVGSAAVLNPVLTVQLPNGPVVNSASMPDAACAIQPGIIRCELAQLAPSESRRLTVRMTIQLAEDHGFTNTVTSTGDTNSSNDTNFVTVHVARETDVGLKVTPQPVTATTGDPIELTYEVSSSGILPLNDMQTVISGVGLTATSVSVDSGTCALESPQKVACQLGTIAAGTARHIRVQWVADLAGDRFGFVRATSTSDPTIFREVNFRVTALAARDVAISAPATFKRVAIGADALWSLDVVSQGVNTVDDVHVRLSSTADVTIAVDPPLDASCTISGGATECALGAMAPQTTRTIHFRTRAGVAINADVLAQIVLPTPDNQPNNDTVSMSLDVRVGDEISVQTGPPSQTYDGRVTLVSASVLAAGANASENIQVHVTLPAGFVVQTATFFNEPCTIPAATPNLVVCSAARIEATSSMFIALWYVAPQPGSYAGSIEVSAASDTDPSNNSATLNFEVMPNVDARLTAPVRPERGRIDVPVDLVFTIETNKYALPDAKLELTWFGALAEFSASAPGATCGNSPNGYTCEWPSIAANTSVQVAVRLRSSVRVSASISAFLYASVDTDFSSNSAFVTFPIVVPGDVALSVTQPTATATADQWFSIPGIDLIVLTEVEGAFIDLTFEQSRMDLVSVPNASCSQTNLSPVMHCWFYDVQAPGTYHFDVQVVPRGAGALPIAMRVGALNDFNTANDEQTMTLTIVASTPPPPPPPPPPPSGGNSGGGGGGGGSMSWLLAALLFLMWHHRRARSRVHR
jgi:hypothetical protein